MKLILLAAAPSITAFSSQAETTDDVSAKIIVC
jgi:hypothetical protein